jgi:hypothetical protein
VNDHQGVSFTVAATPAGTTAYPLNVQWQENNGIDDIWVNIPGETGFTYNTASHLVGPNSNQGYRYRAVVSNARGTAISSMASITINTPPEITSQNTTVTADNNAYVTLSATATGSPTPTAQWSVSKDRGVTFTSITGATGTSYTFRPSNADNFNFYRVSFSNTAGTDTSNNILLLVTMYSSPRIVSSPASQTAILGSANVTFTVDYSGSEVPSVQWQVKRADSSAFVDIVGATGFSYTIATVSTSDRSAMFRAILTNRQGTVTSDAATLTVPLLSPPVITMQPTIVGRTTVGSLVTIMSHAIGSPTPTAQWQRTDGAGSAYYNIGTAGANMPNLQFVAQLIDDKSSFRVVYSNSNGTVTSTTVSISIARNTPPMIDQQPVPVSVVEGQTAVFFVIASGDPYPNLQWQVSSDYGFTYTNLTGQYSDTLRITGANAVNDKFYYRVLANNTNGFVFSQAAYLTVVRPQAPVFVRQPASIEVPVGGSVVFHAEATGSPRPALQWEVSHDGTTFSAVAGATTPALEFIAMPATQQVSYYRVKATNSAGAATSSVATLVIFSRNAPVVKVQPSSKSIRTDSIVSLYSMATGTPTPTVQWYSRASYDKPWAPISGATYTTYTFKATAFQQYRATFQNTDGSANSSIATINVYGRLYRVSRSSASVVSASIVLVVVALLALAL